MSIKLTLVAARTNADLTRAEAAKQLGISIATLVNWETGKTYPNALQIKRIEDVYNVEYSDLIFLRRDYH